MVLDCEEADRWLRQARYTLESVRSDYDGGFYSWACFKANQAAEYSLKAVLRAGGVESFGHDLMGLWRRAKSLCPGLEDLRDCIALLNKMYVPTRYPDAWPGGATPFENYTRRDAEEALECSVRVYRAVEECLGEECEGA
ncbi:HEPN domain-containing protein [Aeropyrum camini]|uniref:HEPN domain-containing protein n=1 Tax=Aeropyrum camini TaxID=229980 RepID=UPI0011E5D18E|nr:HEPN domain-containing protein [Aeropyrum camini]